MSHPWSYVTCWLFTPAPMLKVCRYNEAYGYETFWRGLIIGPFAFGILWRKRLPALPDPKETK